MEAGPTQEVAAVAGLVRDGGKGMDPRWFKGGLGMTCLGAGGGEDGGLRDEQGGGGWRSQGWKKTRGGKEGRERG